MAAGAEGLSVEQQVREADAYAQGYKDGARAAIQASAAVIDLAPAIRQLLKWIDDAESR